MEGSHFICLCCVLMLCTIVPTLPIHEQFMMLIFLLALIIVLIAIIISDRCIVIYNKTESNLEIHEQPATILILNPDPHDITIGHPCTDASENERNGKSVNTSMN